MNVAEVAVHCGFSDSSAFIKQFRKYKGSGKFEVVSTDDSTLVFTRTLPDNKVTVKAQLKAPWGYEIIAE